MKKNIIILALLACNLVSESVFSQNTVSWVSTSESQQWIKQKSPKFSKATDKIDVEIKLDKPQQKIEGFGACFNELDFS